MPSEYPPGIRPFEYDRITDRVLAGRNPLLQADIERLLQEGVTHILDLREAQEWMPPNIGKEAVDFQHICGLQRKHLPIPDFTTPDQEDFTAAVIFLVKTLRVPNAQVYVHCRAGMERTPTILVAYFALEWETSSAETLARLQQARPKFQPLPHQWEAVNVWLAGSQGSS